MRRRPYAIFAAAIAAAALAAPTASAAGPFVTETAGATFPHRSFALTLPEARTVTADDVELRENGTPVRGVTVRPAEGAGARQFGIVLAIDTSNSMRGRPLDAAVAAAREFVRNRNAAQPIAVVTFAGAVTVAQPFTTDSAAIDEALAGIEVTGRGTLLIDAAQRGVDLIDAADLRSGAVVMVSDGADWHSQGTVGGVATAARAANARIYTIGVKSRTGNSGVPNLLAAGTGGEFSAVDSLTDLARVYGRLGARLGHQYIVEYDSAAAAGRPVDVEVRVDGVDGVGRTAYRSPPPARHVKAPFMRRPIDGVWLTPAIGAVIAFVIGILVFVACWVILRPRSGGLRERMSVWVSPPEELPEASESERGLRGRLLDGAERSLDGRAWWDRYKEALDIGRIEVAPVRLLMWIGLGTLAVLLVLSLVFGSPAFGLLAGAVPYFAWRVIQRRVTRQRLRFSDQMPDNMQVIASAMRAGHSFAGALSVVVEDAPEPANRELTRVISDERLGVPLDVALARAVRRMDNKDLEQVALVATLQRETGGNTAEVLDRVAETVRERLRIRRMVASLTAQGRMSRWVLTGIPVFLMLIMTAINPRYMSPLYTTGVGHVLLVACVVMITAGSLLIKRIVDIKV